MADALTLAGVAAGYAGHPVLHGLHARLDPARIVAVIGPNGAGKSTLLRVCMGLLPPSAGAVRLGDADLGSLDPGARARRLALVPQDVRWAFPFTVRDVVLMGRHPHQTGLRFADAADEALAERAMRDADVLHLAARPVDALSGGELRRVALAGALAQDPEILLLDEPAAGLDIGHQEGLRAAVARLRQERGVASLVAMHDLSLAAALADELWLLADGRLRAAGPPGEVLTPALLEEVYGVPCEVRQGPGALRVDPKWGGR